MRTNIEIDDELMEKALKKTGLKTKKAVVEEGLKKLIESKNQKELLKYFGKLKWEGDLDEMRTSKHVS